MPGNKFIILLIVSIISYANLCAQKRIDKDLLLAVKSNDLPSAKKLLSSGANPNVTDSNFATPLMWAAYNSNLPLFKWLVANGADYKKKGAIYLDSSGYSGYYGNILGIAAAKNDTVLLSYCLSELKINPNDVEFDPKNKKEDGWTPLQWAANNGCLSAVFLLLNAGADINKSVDSTRSALLLAAEKEHDDLFLFLCKQKNINPSVKNENGWKAIHYICDKFDEPSLVEELYQKGADIAAGTKHDFETPLYLAACAGHTNTCLLLLKLLNNEAILTDSIWKSAIRVAKFHDQYETALIIQRTMQDHNSDKQIDLLIDSLSVYKTLGAEADSCKDSYEFKCAEKKYSDKLLLCKAIYGSNSPEYAKCLSDIAACYKEYGDYAKALDYTEKSLHLLESVVEDWEQSYHFEFWNLYDRLGDLYFHWGCNEIALEYYQKAERMAGRYSYRSWIYGAMMEDLAEVYLQMYDNKKALDYARKALENRERSKDKYPSAYASCLQTVGGIYINMSEGDSALHYFEKALPIFQSGSDSSGPAIASCFLAIADVYIDKRRFNDAYIYCNKAINIYASTLGTNHPSYASALRITGACLMKMGRIKEGIQLMRQALVMKTRFLKDASTNLSRSQLLNFVRDNYYYFEMGYSLALNYTDRDFVKQVYETQLLLKGISLENGRELFDLFSKETDSSTMQIVKAMKTLRDKLSSCYQHDAISEEIDEYENKYSILEQQLLGKSPQIQEKISQRNINYRQVQDKLKEGEAAIEFVHFQYWNNCYCSDSVLYAAFLLLPHGEPRMIGLCPEKMLEQRVNDREDKNSAYVNNLYQVKTGDRGVVVESTGDIGKSLYQLIWSPIDSLLKGVKTIYYAPSGLLHRINLSAINYSGNKMLGDKYEFHLLGSTRDIVKYQSPILEIKKDTMLAYGGILYDMDSSAITNQRNKYFPENSVSQNNTARSGSGFHWERLSGSKDELDSISKMTRVAKMNCHALAGYDATEESFKYYTSRSKSPAFIHVATHGFFYANSESDQNEKKHVPYFIGSQNAYFRSGITFAGSNNVSMGNDPVKGIEDGIVTADDITRMNLQNTKLIVLSACETGLGSIDNTEGVFGLQRAIRLAGCKNLIMSLWRVPDIYTTKFMNLFYKKLILGKMSVYDSFQFAQKQMMELYRDDPYRWAGFVLME